MTITNGGKRGTHKVNVNFLTKIKEKYLTKKEEFPFSEEDRYL
jgi:hypothetical protein